MVAMLPSISVRLGMVLMGIGVFSNLFSGRDVLRRLRRDRVGEIHLRIHPEVGRNRIARGHRYERLLDILLRQSELRRSRPIDIDPEIGAIHHLLEMNIHSAGIAAIFLRRSRATSELPSSVPCTSTSIGAGRPKSRIWVTMSAGSK